MDNLFDVAGKTALVTGGGSGIGTMIAQGFVEAGVKTYIASRKLNALEETAEELNRTAAPGGECIPIAADLSAEAGVLGLAAALKEKEDKLHILVNNSGATWGAPYEEYPDEAFDKIFNLNVKAIFTLTRELTPLLEAAGTEEDPARVINTSSVAAFGAGDTYAYGASKAAVNQLTRAQAATLTRRHITVNAIAPGPFHSRMMNYQTGNPEIRAAMGKANPRGRIGSPEDAAGTAIFLSSRAGAYISGTIIPLDGGSLIGSARNAS